MPIIRKATPEVKDAVLEDKISAEQAERISNLKTETQRKKAIQQHEDIKHVQKNVEKSVKQQDSAKDKKKIAKDLAQSSNWIASIKGSVNDFRKQSEITLKILLVSTKFIPMMDDKQKERFDNILNELVEISEKMNQFTKQIREKI